MEHAKYYAGAMLSYLMPDKTEMVRNEFTIPATLAGTDDRVGRLIRYYMGARELRTNEHSERFEDLHRAFWAHSEGYFAENKERVEKYYIPEFSSFVDALSGDLVRRQINAVYEMGTGDGKWLYYLSRKWNFISRFVGIDICGEQIKQNRFDYPCEEFVESDLIRWVEQYSGPYGLYHSNGGVLEYLAEASVYHLFSVLSRRAPGSLIFIIEPVYGDFDLEKDTSSRIIGYEHSYSHNYPYLLKTAGCNVILQEERWVDGHRLMLVLAETPGCITISL